MLRFYCPLCGLRDETEFEYGGDATVTRPAVDETDMTAWSDHLFARANPRGPHVEYWRHAQGCGQWLVVERDTLTHAVGACRLAAPAARWDAPETPAEDGAPAS